ncbi:MAG: DUF2892 domain-containing protein [Candidatus Eisenbacteria bacterium]|nr:DUF2892 domain-containing protein [Candidatus Eisenbacteria bacterium]
MSQHDSSSMENIIRRFAGVFVLASLGLGWWVHPAWFLFTAFVGFNLLQSSFTGICPLETILRKLGVGRGKTEPAAQR